MPTKNDKDKWTQEDEERILREWEEDEVRKFYIYAKRNKERRDKDADKEQQADKERGSDADSTRYGSKVEVGTGTGTGMGGDLCQRRHNRFLTGGGKGKGC